MVKQLSLSISTLLIACVLVASTGSALAQGSADDASKMFSRPPELEALRAANVETLSTAQYVDKQGEEVRADYVQARMQERIAIAKAAGKEGSSDALGFYEISDGSMFAARGLAYAPTIPQRRFLSRESKSYLLPGADKTKQLHTKTLFGNLLIDEFKGATATLESPNMTVGGYPATFTHLRYKGERWATAVYVVAGDRFFVIEADRKIEGKQKTGFIELVSSLILTARG